MRKNLLSLFLVAISVATLMVSCSDYDNGYTETDIAYAAKFRDVFGNVDPNQNWDLYGQLVAQGNSTMGTRAASDIVVTDLGEAYYRNVTSDMNKQYQKMLPESEDNPRTYAATNLGRVTQNFSAYTTEITLYPIHWNTSGADVVGIYYYTNSSDSEATAVTGTDGKTYYIVTKEVYSNKTHVEGVKETTAYDYVTACTDAHWNELVAAYPEKYFISDGTQKNQYGGTISEGTKIIKSDVKKEDGYAGSGNYYDVYYRWNLDVVTDLAADLIALHSNYAVADGTDTYKNAYGYTIENGKLVELKTTCTYGGVNTYQDLSSAFIDYTYLRSKPIQVTIPANVGKIGFYIKNGTPIRYSESKLNSKLTFSDAGEKEACYVATYIDTDAEGNEIEEDGKPVRYLCFEDWMGGATNFDLNDVVFRVYGLDEGGSSIVDEDETYEDAIVVCEDLGDFDFDFNDVVFSVQYYTRTKKTYNRDAQGNVTSVVTGETENGLRIVPLAAGGTLESTIVFDYGATVNGSQTVEISNGSSNEIHQLLGGSAPSIINAGPNFGGSGAAIILDANYLPTTDKGSYPTLVSRFFAEDRFKVVSTGAGQTGEAKRMVSSAGYKTKGAPQMMLLPNYYEWAQELTPIEEAYPNFTQWVSDATATDWISSKISSKVTSRGIETPQSSAGTGGNQEPATEPESSQNSKGDLITTLSGVTTSGKVWSCSGYFVPSSLLTGATKITVTFEGTHTSFMANAAGTTSFNDSFTGSSQSVPDDKLAACVSEGFYICFNNGFDETQVYIKIDK